MLEMIARGLSPESLAIESRPALFQNAEGKRVVGRAGIVISRSSIALRFATDGDMVVPKAAYGESSGSIVALDGGWSAPRVNNSGPAADGDRLFGTMSLIASHDAAQDVAATRLVVAGGAWQGAGVLDGRRVIAQPLSQDVVSYHNCRMSLTIEGDADDDAIAAMERACAFVTGMDLSFWRWSAIPLKAPLERRLTPDVAVPSFRDNSLHLPGPLALAQSLVREGPEHCRRRM